MELFDPDKQMANRTFMWCLRYFLASKKVPYNVVNSPSSAVVIFPAFKNLIKRRCLIVGSIDPSLHNYFT